MTTVQLTAAQAMVRWLSGQYIETPDGTVPYFAGVWAIFGHGNVAGLGEALYSAQDSLPTWRGHNEQTMAHAAIAFAKQSRRQRAMVCTTSIGPGALNMVTAAALAHVNRLPVLLVPGDVFASRQPDPVLQQIEDFEDATVSANDCFRAVSRYFDRITRPDQLLAALPRAMATLTDPVQCGPVTLAFCQDVQAEAYLWPEGFFARKVWRIRRPQADPVELEALVEAVRGAKTPMIIAGGGVLYSGAEAALADLAEATGIPVAETQGGKGSLVWDHPLSLGAVGVTGSSAANKAVSEADLIVGIGTRLQDFTTGSRALVDGRRCRMIQVNVQPYDATKQHAEPVVADALSVIEELKACLSGWRAGSDVTALVGEWNAASGAVMAAPDDDAALPSDAQVIGAVWRNTAENAVVVCAAGGLPGELHKNWRTRSPGGYHVEYGFSCMGYEIAAGIGAKMAQPERDVVVMVGDGSYMMANSEIASAVAMGLDLTIVVLDNRGFGCINRLQQACGGAPFNNLWANTRHEVMPSVDFAQHAASMGASASKVGGIAELEAALGQRGSGVNVLVIDTDPAIVTAAGGAWWEVAVPSVSDRLQVNAAYDDYARRINKRDHGDME
ncbi:MAG: 3D-(3,5/4)-trihydroxycyclohexane-1,2-dione acylhydrolase (decyclizing) [Sphingobium sp.]|jgi:3D-(3,5/4)-trihydroxycyclohexane-1,2-dione acylhydrolase (decyclizing)|nr:3D-(3,5/4)-trihydroxycyclohexane-1,2-dione acylhydrolase (decyclizing) [Sphingobium sp.]MCP5400054.1 3D-(3,5/4)-trihydroxycyclohexane-1,2-dione acylhydrolase (decyclizing) [Sphingomonas sp.]